MSKGIRDTDTKPKYLGPSNCSKKYKSQTSVLFTALATSYKGYLNSVLY